jgi:hypothetical protein
MATTPNYGWVMPDPTDFVTDLPADFEIFGDAVDATVDGIETKLDVITTEGDLVVGDASGDPVRVPVGTVGQVLASDGDTVEWVTPAGGGGYTQLATGSFSGVSTLTISGISSSYKDLVLVLDDVSVAVNFALEMRVNGITTSDYVSAFSNNTANTSATSFTCFSTQFAGTADNKYVINFPDYANTASWKTMYGTFKGELAANYAARLFFGGVRETAAISSITIFETIGSNNFTAGTYTLYGVS